MIFITLESSVDKQDLVCTTTEDIPQVNFCANFVDVYNTNNSDTTLNRCFRIYAVKSEHLGTCNSCGLSIVVVTV